MKTNFKITKIKHIHKSFFPIVGRMTTRGEPQGQSAKRMECVGCGDAIKIGEQYFNLHEELGGLYCLGCVEYSIDF